MKERSIEKQWKLIKKTGGLHILEAIKDRKPEDFDSEIIEMIADFVGSAPPDTQASIKRKLRGGGQIE